MHFLFRRILETRNKCSAVQSILLQYHSPLTSSPFQNKFLDILCAAKDFPRQGLPTIVTTKGALIQHGVVTSTVVVPLLIVLSESDSFAKSTNETTEKYRIFS